MSVTGLASSRYKELPDPIDKERSPSLLIVLPNCLILRLALSASAIIMRSGPILMTLSLAQKFSCSLYSS